MTPNDLAALGVRIDRAETFQPIIDAAAPDFDINTPQRMAAFLAQVLHESGLFRWLVEIWGPTDAQARYEGRTDLGNNTPGDGYKFRGRGLIQITGRANYMAASLALATDFVSSPELLGEPDMAVRSAMWFWRSRGLNELADAGDFERITRRINGGLNGQTARVSLWEAAKKVLA